MILSIPLNNFVIGLAILFLVAFFFMALAYTFRLWKRLQDARVKITHLTEQYEHATEECKREKEEKFELGRSKQMLISQHHIEHQQLRAAFQKVMEERDKLAEERDLIQEEYSILVEATEETRKQQWLNNLTSTMYRNEVEVEVKFVYSLLKFLGYEDNVLELRSPVQLQVGRESRIVQTDWVVRGHARNSFPPALFVIEAKAPTQALDDSVQAQARSYAYGLNVSKYVITNGRRFKIFQRGITRDSCLVDCDIGDLLHHWRAIEQEIAPAAFQSEQHDPSHTLMPPTCKWFYEQDRQRVYSFLSRQLNEGKQALVIALNRKVIDDIYKQLGPLTFQNHQVGIVLEEPNGENLHTLLNQFASGQIDVLFTNITDKNCTTANTGIVVVEQAERFSLKQLINLRDWTPKEATKTYFAMLSSSVSEEVEERLLNVTSGII
jgi:hypothetical protein